MQTQWAKEFLELNGPMGFGDDIVKTIKFLTQLKNRFEIIITTSSMTIRADTDDQFVNGQDLVKLINVNIILSFVILIFKTMHTKHKVSIPSFYKFEDDLNQVVTLTYIALESDSVTPFVKDCDKIGIYLGRIIRNYYRPKKRRSLLTRLAYYLTLPEFN